MRGVKIDLIKNKRDSFASFGNTREMDDYILHMYMKDYVKYLESIYTIKIS